MHQFTWILKKWETYQIYQKNKKRAIPPLIPIIDQESELYKKDNNVDKRGLEIFVAPLARPPDTNCLTLGKIKSSNQQHMKALSKVRKAYPKVQAILLSECQVSAEILNSISNVMYLVFRGCNLRNNYADILEQSCYKSIQQFFIHSDWIGNVGIKKLMKLHMPNLRILCLQNTNITTDFAKMLSKKQWKNMIGITLCKQFKFNYDQLMKTMKYMDTKQFQESQMLFIGSFDWGQTMFLYWGQLSKIRINDDIENVSERRFKIASIPIFTQLQQPMLLPTRTGFILGQGICITRVSGH